MDVPNNSIFITFVDKEGPFLKVWGQTDKQTSVYIESVLHSFTNQFDNGVCLLPAESINVGDIICAKYKDNIYYRAKVTNIVQANELIEVNFIDYGNQDIIPVVNVRSLEPFDKNFPFIPPQAHAFILAEAVCFAGEWNETIFQQISKEIRYAEVNCSIVAQVSRHFLVRLYVSTNDLAILLIRQRLMQHTSLQTQEAVLLATMSRPMPQSIQQPVQHNLATYKAHVLEPGNQYEVYVSYVTDGPSNFSIQLKQTEDALSKLMRELNAMPLTPLEGVSVPGTVCLAKCVEDEHICRAVVTNEVDGQYKVFYVDFGNFEVVPLDALYEIPFKYVIPKVMAIRFALAGVDKTSITFDMLRAFKRFVDDRLIHMKVLPMPQRTGLPLCELWDPETGTTALDILNQAAAASYPKNVTLTRGYIQIVKVSYVFSCNRFFVQLKSKSDELLRLMLDLQNSCQEQKQLDSVKIKVGMPCCTLFEGDGQWYRSQIVEIVNPNQVKVQYVDFGNEEIVNNNLLKPIDGSQLTVLRPQAIECCLNGYQNMGQDMERDGLLEQLILEQEFTMKVVEIRDKKALVELIDGSNYNVASLLLDKMAASRSQVSPMLVQAGNVIEHRKGPPPPFRNSEERKSNERPQKQWSKHDNFWRSDNNRGHRNNRSAEPEDSNDKRNGFRQQNKPFRNDRNNRRENDLNNSTDSDRSNKSFNRNDSGDNWRQNNKDTNKNRPNRDMNNRNNDWNSGGGGDAGSQDRKSFSPREKTSNGWNNSSRNNEKRNNDWNRDDKQHGSGREYRDGGNTFRDRNNSFNKRNNNGRFDGGGEFKRAASEASSNGSEKGYNNKRNFKENKDRPTFGNKRGDNFKKSPTKTMDVPNPAGPKEKFRAQDVAMSEASVTISWFHNPSHFYCLIENDQSDFKRMMEEIQEAYKDKSPSQAAVGQPVIGLFPEDNVLYRAKVIDIIGMQYKVYYVDFGNVTVIDKVWPIEMRFMALPSQAICCQLDGIEPIDGKWMQPTNFGQYFNRPQFMCKFIKTDSNLTSVKLENNGEDIGSLLVRDGLAKDSAPAVATSAIEVPFLIGQQFRALLLGMESLSNFGMSLQDGTILHCSIFNVKDSKEQFEDNLKDKINQILIVYVDDVREDNTLEVTLYGSDGAKIKLIDNDAEAYENVELICPYLVCHSTLKGIVTHIESNTAYIQPEDCAENIDYLLNAMFEAYDNQILEQPLKPVENYVYAAKSPSDFNWYRARFVQLEDNPNEVSVNYIDYGNSETVPIESLRELSLNFMEFVIMSVPIVVETISESLIGNVVKMAIKFTENGIEGTIDESLQVEEEIAAAPPSKIEEAAVVPVVESVVEAIASEIPPAKTEEQSSATQVLVSHIDSPCDFYVQLVESQAAIEELQENLQQNIDQMIEMENPTVGVLCAAPYSVDQQWYRAQVLDAIAEITTVRFVDFGNTDVINNSLQNVKTLPPNLLSIEMHATRCRLKIKPIEEEWSAAASERFEHLCGEESIRVEFINQDEKTNYVKLYSNGKSIDEILISEGLAMADEQVSDETQGTNGFISHLNSPSEFWIQLENCIDELELIAEQLGGAESFKELEDLAPGTLCAALFPDDGMWYRARILSNTVAGIEVLFVDYGNSCTSCSLRELPEELAMVSPLAQKCSLQKPEKLQQWGPEMIRKFTEIAADGLTTFLVKKIKTGETALVDLIMSTNENVIDLILPKCENVIVNQCKETLDEIELVKNGEKLPEMYTLEHLPEMLWNEESVVKFNELVNETKGEMLVEFVDGKIVRLYTPGLNDIRLSLSGTKTPTSSPIKIAKVEQQLQIDTSAEEEVLQIHEEGDDDVFEDSKHSIDDTNESTNENDIKNMVSEMLGTALESNANQIVQPILDEIVYDSCNESTELNNEETIECDKEEKEASQKEKC